MVRQKEIANAAPMVRGAVHQPRAAGALDAFNIHAGGGAAVPVPGATLALSYLITLNAEATPPCEINDVEVCETRAGNDHVDVFDTGGGHCDVLVPAPVGGDTIPAPRHSVRNVL